MNDRRKKLKFRAWRRGFREIDLILGPFADQHLAAMSERELDLFEELLTAPDQDAYGWILGQSAPAQFETEILEAVRRFRADMGAKPA